MAPLGRCGPKVPHLVRGWLSGLAHALGWCLCALTASLRAGFKCPWSVREKHCQLLLLQLLFLPR